MDVVDDIITLLKVFNTLFEKVARSKTMIEMDKTPPSNVLYSFSPSNLST